MLRRNNNHFMSVVSNYDVLTTALPAVGTVVTSANIPSGAVVLTDVGLRRLDNTAYLALQNEEQFFIVQGCGVTQPLLKSPVLTKGRVTFSSKKHLAAKQQITAIGFNGTTGELPVANNTAFHIKIRKNDNDAANRSQPASLTVGPVKTDSTGTQAELAFMLARSANLNFRDEAGNGYLKFEVLTNDAGAAIGAAGITIVGAKGSKVVTLTGTAIGGAVVGNLFRAGTALTDDVYKIVSTTIVGGATGTITLDRPLSKDVSLLGTTAEFVTAANATTADFGIILTGVENAFDVNKFRNYYANRFTATFSDENTLVTHLQGAINGNGVWQQVAMDEYMTWGFEGQNEMLSVPPRMRNQYVKVPNFGTNTVANSRYSVAQISWTEIINQGITTLSGAKGSVLIYANLSSAGSLSATDNTGRALLVALGVLSGAGDTSLNV